MPWWLLLIPVAAQAIGTVAGFISGEQAKGEAQHSAEKIKSDLDTLLGTEQGKLTTEYGVQKERLEDYAKEVLGSQRQGFAVRGDVGGIDSGAAAVIRATERKSAEDRNLLEKEYQAVMDTLAQQTQLAKDQLDDNLKQFISGITSQEISGITSLATSSLTVLAGMKLPAMPKAAAAPTVLDYDSITRGAALWDSALGIPRLS